MARYRQPVTEERFTEALALAYVKGDVPEPLPDLDPDRARTVVKRIVQHFPIVDLEEWYYILMHYPTLGDPRTHNQVVDDVRAWANQTLARYFKRYRRRKDRPVMTVWVDPDHFAGPGEY